LARLLVAIAILLTACSPAHQVDPGDQAFWVALQINADEVEGYASLDEMAAAADLVVVGSFSDFGLTRVIQGDAPQDQVGMGGAIVSVDRAYKGSVPRTLIVEFVLPVVGTTEDFVAYTEGLKETLPSGPMLLLLRDKGGSEAGLYRLVNSLGLWVLSEQGMAAPLYPLTDSTNQPYAGELVGVSSVEGLAEKLTR
jgi:hypothetical protein